MKPFIIALVLLVTINAEAGMVKRVEKDPVVKAINGVVKSNGTTISACSNLSDVAYLTAEVDGSTTNEINTFTLPDANVTAGLGITFAQSGSIAITESAADTILFTVTETDPTITAGDALTRTGANIDFDGGASPGGELGGTWASPTIDETGISLTSITIGSLLGVDSIDATGAVDMDYGSNDITDHTFVTDGGTVILDGNINSSTLTASEIVITDASKNLISAAVATYPSLTELSYVKGLSSAVQTQIGGKQATVTEGSLADSVIVSADIKDGTITAADMGVTTNISGLPFHLYKTIIDPLSVQTEDGEICLVPETDAAITITNIRVTLDATTNEVAGDVKFADTFIALANATVIETFDTTSGVRSDDAMSGDATIPSGKCIYLSFDSAPNTAIHQMCIEIRGDYD